MMCVFHTQCLNGLRVDVCSSYWFEHISTAGPAWVVQSLCTPQETVVDSCCYCGVGRGPCSVDVVLCTRDARGFKHMPCCTTSNNPGLILKTIYRYEVGIKPPLLSGRHEEETACH